MRHAGHGQPIWVWALRLGLGLLALALVCPGLGVALTDGARALPGLCVFRGVTGWPCPGCGMGHAGLRLLAGDPVGAWHCHPFVYLVVALALIAAILSPTRRYRLVTHRSAQLIVLPMLGLLVARWIGVLAG